MQEGDKDQKNPKLEQQQAILKPPQKVEKPQKTIKIKFKKSFATDPKIFHLQSMGSTDCLNMVRFVKYADFTYALIAYLILNLHFIV